MTHFSRNVKRLLNPREGRERHGTFVRILLSIDAGCGWDLAIPRCSENNAARHQSLRSIGDCICDCSAHVPLFLLCPRQHVSALIVWQNLNWSSLALGIAVVMIETGYLVAYRMGWKLNQAALTSNVAVAILLIPLGAILFQERVSFRMTAGASLCIAGLILLVR